MPQWGCIADDVTGATDLATNLVSRGLRTVVLLQPFSDSGVPLGPEAVVEPGQPVERSSRAPPRSTSR